MDSSVLVARAHESGRLRALVTVFYGQPAALQEWRAVREIRAMFGVAVPWFELHVDLRVGRMADPAGVAGPRVVPARNAVLVALAANRAVDVHADEVWLGAIADDARDYEDCRPEAVTAMAAACGVRVVAPLVETPKSAVVAEAASRGLLALAWSCYAPRDGLPCGACGSCCGRAGASVGLAAAGERP